MRVLALAALMLTGCAPGAHAAMLVDTDFGTADQPILGGDGKSKARVTGVLPKGWLDNSEWAQVWANCRVMEEEGRKFLRCHVTRFDSGRFQLAFQPLPDITGETYFRLTARVRNFSSSPIEMGLRMLPEPYTMLWSTTNVFGKDWRTSTWDFALGKNEKPLGFFVLAGGVGEFDLALLKLERLTREELIEELKRKYPDEGPPNLLRNSRLPLGLQSGWALGRECSDGDDVKIEADPEVKGPSGAPALRIESPQRTLLRFEPFGVVYPLAKHKAVLYAKGEGNWKCSILADGKGLASRSFRLTAGADWQPVEVEFMPRLMEKVYEWRVEGLGKLWLDALQAGPSGKVKGYASAGECEVALACPPGEASVARVQFEQEPAEVRWCVTGKADGATLKAKVVNLYGEEQPLPDAKLGAEFLSQGTFRFDVFPQRPYGGFRIEAWVERDGKRVSPFNELVLYRLKRPAHWKKDGPRSPFGTHTLSTTRHILMAKAIGVNWTRLHDAGLEYIGWWNLEPEQGQWRFFDKELNRYRQHGMKIYAELGTAPKWASYYTGSGKKGFGYFDKFFQPRDLSQYANYVRTVATRYKGTLDAFDVWNEPWIHAWWAVRFDTTAGDERAGYLTSEKPQADFARLQRTAYETVKSVDEKSVVAGFNSTTGPGWKGSFSGSQWTQGVLDAGGLEWCDFVEYHHYTNEMSGFPGDTVTKGLREAFGPIVGKLGKIPKPIWMTEGNGAIGLMASGVYKRTLPYEDNEDYHNTANRLCRYVASQLAHGVGRVFLYSMHCHDFFSPKPAEWSVFVTQEGYLHPSAAAHAALAWHLEETKPVRTFEVSEGVFAMLFQGEGRCVAVLAQKPGAKPYEVPVLPGVKAADLYGNPVAPKTPLTDKLVYLSAQLDAGELEKLLAAKP